MTARHRLLVETAALLLTLATLGEAQTQRLVIPSADLVIPSGGSARIDTFCVDYGRTGPRKGDTYSHVLSAPDSASISVGGRTLTLQQAIDQHLLRLEAVQPSLNQQLRSLRSFEEIGVVSSTRAAMERDMLRSLTRQELSGVLAEEQNPATIRIVNLSGQDIRFTSQRGLLGTAAEGAGEILTALNGDLTSQSGLWISQVQRFLTDEGYRVTVDGKLGPATRNGLRRFQVAHGLEGAGSLNKATMEALRTRAHDRAELVNPLTADFAVVRLENRHGSYRLLDAFGNVLYSGSVPHDMTKAILSVPGSKQGTTYIDMDGFTDKEIENLSRSFRTMEEIEARPIARQDGVPLSRDLLLSKGIRLERISEPTLVTEGPRKGWVRAVLHFLVTVGSTTVNTTLEVVASSRERLSAFVVGLGLKQGAADIDASLSLAQAVSRSRKRIAREYNEPVDVILRDNARFMIVDVLRSIEPWS